MMRSRPYVDMDSGLLSCGGILQHHVRDEREAEVLRALFVTLVVVVSVKVVLVMLSVKVPSPVGGAGNSTDKSFADLLMAPPLSEIRAVTDRPFGVSAFL